MEQSNEDEITVTNGEISSRTISPLSNIRSFSHPISQQQSIIHELVSSSSREINNIEAEIAGLQSKLSNLQRFNEIQRSLLVQARNVTDEVLSFIFTLARGDGIQIGQARDSIVDMQQVCSRWRNIIRGTPSLWNAIQLTIIDKKWATEAKMRARIQFCVRLSGTRPLSVTLLPYFPIHKFYPTLRPKYVTLIDNIIHEISKYSYRWAYLSLECGLLLSRAYVVPADSYLRLLPKDKLPNLKKVSMTGSDTDGVFDALQSAISIEDVVIEDCIIGNLRAFPWKNVKKLTMKECFGGRPFHVVLPLMPLLEELTMENHFIEYNGLGQQPAIVTVTLPLLHTLDISRIESRIICQFLLTPRLVNLRISEGFRNQPGDPSDSYLFDMIENSQCIIKRLEILCYDDEFVVTALTHLHHVEDLSVECFGRANAPAILQKLAWSSSSPSSQLLPALKHIEIKLDLESSGTSRFTEKQQLETLSQLHENCFGHLTNIMRSRFPTVNGEVFSLGPSRLSVFKTTIKGIRPKIHSKYKSAAANFKKVGISLGIMVAVDLHLFKEEPRRARSAKGVSALGPSDETKAHKDEYY